MTPVALESLKSEVNSIADTVDSLGEAIAPQYKTIFVLGKLAAKAFPDLLNDVEGFLEKTDPTQEENDALAAKIHSLANPESL